MTSYVIGPWVRGDRFYGRRALLDELLAARTGHDWVVGCRRVGKTSLLRQLELEAPAHGFAPLVWDLQGAEDATELALALEDALLDAAAGHAALGIEAPDRVSTGVGAALRQLAAAARGRGLTPLLLLDEVEELLRLAEVAPAAVAALGESLGGPTAPRAVMVSSVRLAELRHRAELTGPLERALAAPHWLGPLEPAAAAALVRQAQQPGADRPALSETAVARVVASTGGHPYLTQLVAKRACEAGDDNVDLTVATLRQDPAVRSLVAVDLELLAPADRALCLATVAGRPCEPAPGQLARLVGLGLLRADPAGGPPLPGHAFL